MQMHRYTEADFGSILLNKQRVKTSQAYTLNLSSACGKKVTKGVLGHGLMRRGWLDCP
jgi:hypothetical protein